MSDVPSKAYARINSILDSKSFVEIGKSITARSTDFNLDAKKMPGDGVITGYGLINNQLVYIYSQGIYEKRSESHGSKWKNWTHRYYL